MALNTFKIEFEFSLSTWTEVSGEIDTAELVKNELLHNGLRPADSSVNLRIPNPSTAFISALYAVGSDDVAVRIHKNDADYYYGYLRKTFTLEKGQRIQPIALEVVSPSNLLKRKIKTSLSYVGHTVAALLDHLLTEAGLTGYTLPTITTVIPAFAVEPNTTTWHEVISEILFEYGYTLGFDAAGVAIFPALFPATFDPSTRVFDGDNCLVKIVQEKQEQARDTVEAKWNSIKTVTDALVFSDMSNATTLKKCNIGILPGEYLQGESDGFYATLSHPDGELLYTASQSLEITKDGQITVDTFTPGNLRSLLKIYNSDATFERFINKLDIRAGTAIIKMGENTSTATTDGDSEKIETIKASYIFDKTSAGDLAANLLGYFKYADFSYRLVSATDYACGAIVTISEDYIGTIVARIVGKKSLEATNPALVRYEYTLEGVGEWSPAAPAHVIIQTAPPPASLPAAIFEDVLDVPTYAEIIDGFTEGGGTMTPDQPTSGTWNLTGAVASVLVRVSRQTELTNFDHYDIQVKDGAAWYAPVNTGSPWHNATADTFASFTGSSFLHSSLPLDVDGDGAAIATEYEYRIRRVTNEPETSDWSAGATADALPVGAGIIAAEAIVASMIDADVLNALVATINDQLAVGSLGWQAGGGGELVEGSQRVLIQPGVVLFQEAKAVVVPPGVVELQWQDRLKIDLYDGGSGAGNFVPRVTTSEKIVSLNADLLDGAHAAELSPPGSITMYGGAAAPSGWLLCNGASLVRADYAALFATIGTTYGAADGTHFTLPDFRGVFPKGAGTTGRTAGKDANGNYYAGTLGAYLQDKMQGHKHGFAAVTSATGSLQGSGAGINYVGTLTTATPTSDGSNGTPRTGLTTEPQSLGISFIIKT
jgi:microcystin-dependent protein